MAALKIDALKTLILCTASIPCHFLSSFPTDIYLLVFVPTTENGLFSHIYRLVSHFPSSADPDCIDQPERSSECPTPEC